MKSSRSNLHQLDATSRSCARFLEFCLIALFGLSGHSSLFGDGLSLDTGLEIQSITVAFEKENLRLHYVLTKERNIDWVTKGLANLEVAETTGHDKEGEGEDVCNAEIVVRYRNGVILTVPFLFDESHAERRVRRIAASYEPDADFRAILDVFYENVLSAYYYSAAAGPWSDDTGMSDFNVAQRFAEEGRLGLAIDVLEEALGRITKEELARMADGPAASGEEKPFSDANSWKSNIILQYAHLIRYYRNLGRYDEAIACGLKEIDTFSEDDSLCHLGMPFSKHVESHVSFLMGQVCEAAENYGKAREYYQRYLDVIEETEFYWRNDESLVELWNRGRDQVAERIAACEQDMREE